MLACQILRLPLHCELSGHQQGLDLQWQHAALLPGMMSIRIPGLKGITSPDCELLFAKASVCCCIKKKNKIKGLILAKDFAFPCLLIAVSQCKTPEVGNIPLILLDFRDMRTDLVR